MILPDLVFGRSSVKTMLFGLAIGPIDVDDVVAQLGEQFVASLELATQRHERCNGLPGNGSARPTTAASATASWLTRADSTSVVEMLWPAISMTSSTRPSSQK